ncbi:hypothetical protein H0H87_007117 [Tephrocybe sp. NHM501043]|nr:hypothetical protein H0H87_007117 [Tephrocybe sp. NHM501043]
MSHKYADLPDIDTAPDVYETEDVFPSALDTKDEEEDESPPQRGASAKGRNNDVAGKEEIDSSSLIDPGEASRRFRKAERRHPSRTYYAYPPSPTDTSPPPTTRSLPLSARLRSLQTELLALESELADPSNPQLAKEREVDNVDPGELIRGLVDVRGRLDKIRKEKEGRAKLVGTIIGDDGEVREVEGKETTEKAEKEAPSKPEARSIAEMDRRVGDLENLVGSSRASLDESTPLPPPLLPLITRLNSQLTLLSQPRHLDSVTRRLKLLLTDLDRVSASQKNQPRQHHAATPSTSGPHAASTNASIAADNTTTTTLLPLLTRLSPALPQIPHILTRLRTLAALHTSAADFATSLDSLEAEQRRVSEALAELQGAVDGVEESLTANRTVVQGNVSGLESRVERLLGRLQELGRPGLSEA